MAARDGLRSWVRVRETHVRDGLAPLLRTGDWGSAALDLLLRSLTMTAFVSAGGDEEAVIADRRLLGLVDPELPWEWLHDVLRPAGYLELDVKLKRNWISGRMAKLENAGLLAREVSAGRRPLLWVLSDTGAGDVLDDPGASGQPYLTVLSSVFRNRAAREWAAPEWMAYLAALLAEGYSPEDGVLSELNAGKRRGDRAWFRPLTWFEDPAGYRPAHHVRMPFPERTLRRGTKTLREQGWMASRRIWADPRTGEPFAGGTSKLLYFNGFADMAPYTGGSLAQKTAWAYLDPGRDDPRTRAARRRGQPGG